MNSHLGQALVKALQVCARVTDRRRHARERTRRRRTGRVRRRLACASLPARRQLTRDLSRLSRLCQLCRLCRQIRPRAGVNPLGRHAQLLCGLLGTPLVAQRRKALGLGLRTGKGLAASRHSATRQRRCLNRRGLRRRAPRLGGGHPRPIGRFRDAGGARVGRAKFCCRQIQQRQLGRLFSHPQGAGSCRRSLRLCNRAERTRPGRALHGRLTASRGNALNRRVQRQRRSRGLAGNSSFRQRRALCGPRTAVPARWRSDRLQGVVTPHVPTRLGHGDPGGVGAADFGQHPAQLLELVLQVQGGATGLAFGRAGLGRSAGRFCFGC